MQMFSKSKKTFYLGLSNSQPSVKTTTIYLNNSLCSLQIIVIFSACCQNGNSSYLGRSSERQDSGNN